jgi:hypothetical protein
MLKDPKTCDHQGGHYSCESTNYVWCVTCLDCGTQISGDVMIRYWIKLLERINKELERLERHA